MNIERRSFILESWLVITNNNKTRANNHFFTYSLLVKDAIPLKAFIFALRYYLITLHPKTKYALRRI